MAEGECWERRSRLQLRTPKRSPTRKNEWFSYYAGYDSEFVAGLLAKLSLPNGSTVLDPWNGAGTTTDVARRQRHRAIGLDLNPALVAVAKGRQVPFLQLSHIELLLPEIASWRDNRPPCPDPLSTLFTDDAAMRVRMLQRAIGAVLDPRLNRTSEGHPVNVDDMSSLAAFFHVALFKAVRRAVRTLVGRNPTWIRMPSPDQRVDATRTSLETLFSDEATSMVETLRRVSPTYDTIEPVIRTGDSTDLKLEGGTVDAVIGSPPYCTRIDYVSATRPELAVLGFSVFQMEALRRGMIGTPTMGPRGEQDRPLGDSAEAFLDVVARHDSKASSTYYLRYFRQYFNAICDSIAEISRVLAPDSHVALVLQDSYYKEVHNDVALHVEGIGRAVGLEPVLRLDFGSTRNLATINQGARRYRQDFSATESLVILRKP